MAGKYVAGLNPSMGQGGIGLQPGFGAPDLPTTLATLAQASDNANAADKPPVRLASTANIAGTYAGGVLTVTATGALTIDGQTVNKDDRVLLKNQSTQSQNGIYTCTTAGATGVHPALTRASDASQTSDFTPGFQVTTGPDGSAAPNKTFQFTSAAPFVLDTNNATFALTGSAANASTGTPGLVQLAGDLGGTATAPSVGSVGGIALFAIAPVDAVAVANQATMTGVAQTIDGVALNTPGMRVYLAKQTTAAQNGIWVVQSGAWTRPTDWATGTTPPTGTRIRVKPGGTTNYLKYGSEWFVLSASGVIDTGTIIAYPVRVRGQGSLNSASPSVLSVASAWVLSSTQSVAHATNATTAANGVKAVLAADSGSGTGDGTLTVTGPNGASDTIGWSITNA